MCAASKHGVQGYPTLKYSIGGNMKEYKGGRYVDQSFQSSICSLTSHMCFSFNVRLAESLIKFAQKMSSPAVQVYIKHSTLIFSHALMFVNDYFVIGKVVRFFIIIT